MKPTDAMLDVLACAIGKRPKDAPTSEEVFALVTRIERGARTLDLTFDRAVGTRLAAFVDAERQCCASIGWELGDRPEPKLRIIASAEQLDVFEQMLVTAQE